MNSLDTTVRTMQIVKPKPLVKTEPSNIKIKTEPKETKSTVSKTDESITVKLEPSSSVSVKSESKRSISVKQTSDRSALVTSDLDNLALVGLDQDPFASEPNSPVLTNVKQVINQPDSSSDSRPKANLVPFDMNTRNVRRKRSYTEVSTGEK